MRTLPTYKLARPLVGTIRKSEQAQSLKGEQEEEEEDV